MWPLVYSLVLSVPNMRSDFKIYSTVITKLHINVQVWSYQSMPRTCFNTFLEVKYTENHPSFLNIVYSTLERGQAQMMMGCGGGRGKWHSFQGSQHSGQHPPGFIIHWLTETENIKICLEVFSVGRKGYKLLCDTSMCKTWYTF